MVATPDEMPVTTPMEVTVAIEVLLLLQAPPEVESCNVTVEPTQTWFVPEMGKVPEVEPVTVITV